MYCTFCGAKQATGIADPQAYRTIPERYDLVTKQPGHALALDARPRLSAVRQLSPIFGLLLAGGVIVGLVALARWMAVSMIFHLTTLAIGAVVVLSAVISVVLLVRRLAAPTVPSVQVLLGERKPGPFSPTTAHHRVDLRARDGTTRSLYASGELVGSVVAGDIGIAYIQGDTLLEFRWFDVMPAPLAAGEPPRAPSCQACAGPLTFSTKERCTYCGAALAEPELGEHGATFKALASSPAVTSAFAREARGGLPSLSGPAVVFGIGLGLAYILWSLRGLVFFFMEEGTPYAGLAVVPAIGFLLVGVLWLRRRMLLRSAPYVRLLAFVLRRRSVLTGHVNDRPVYRHYVTITAANGARRELRVLQPPSVPDGSFGVAHVRGEWLAYFDPTPG